MGIDQLLKELETDDSVFAIGKVGRPLDFEWNPKMYSSLLVRSGEGTYYVVDEGEPGKTEIRGAIHEVILTRGYKTTMEDIGLVTDSGVIIFHPYDLYPSKLRKLMIFPRVSADFVLSSIKAVEELELLQQCPICNLIRPLDVPQCSNTECATELASLEENSELPRRARVSCMVGGIGGVLAGLILSAIVDAFTRSTNAPSVTRSLMAEYWWILPLTLGVLGYLGLFLILGKEPGKTDQ